MAVATKTPACFQPLITETQNERLWMPLGVNSAVVDGADLLPLLVYVLLLLQVLS